MFVWAGQVRHERADEGEGGPPEGRGRHLGSLQEQRTGPVSWVMNQVDDRRTGYYLDNSLPLRNGTGRSSPLSRLQLPFGDSDARRPVRGCAITPNDRLINPEIVTCAALGAIAKLNPRLLPQTTHLSLSFVPFVLTAKIYASQVPFASFPVVENSNHGRR